MPTHPHKAPVKKSEPPPSTRPDVFVPNPADPKKMTKVGPQDVDMAGFSGKYHKIDEHKDAEPYGLKIVDDDPYGKTHHLKNQEHFWTGTEAEFKAQFEK